MAELGALSLRISAEGQGNVLTALNAVETKARKSTEAEKLLNKEIAEGTRLFALQARTVDTTSQEAVTELRAAAAAQTQWLKSVGASDDQMARFTGTVQTFERRLASATAMQMRQANAITAFGMNVTRSSGALSAFGTRGLSTLNAVAFGVSQLASTGETGFRSLAQAMSGFAAFMGPQGAIASIAVTTGLALYDFFHRTQKQIAETAAKALEEAKRVEGALSAMRRARDPASAVQAVSDATQELNELTIQQAAIEHRTEEARTDAERTRLGVIKARVAELKQEIELNTRAALSPIGVVGTGTQLAVKVTAQSAQTEEQRRAAIAKTVAALEELKKMNALTGADLLKLTATEATLTKELERGNVTRERRVEILQQLQRLTATGTLSTGNLEIGTPANPQLKIPKIPMPELSDQAREWLLEQEAFKETLANGLAMLIASGLADGFARGLASGGIAEGLAQMGGQILSGFGSMLIDLGVKAIAASAVVKSIVAGLMTLNPFVLLAAGVAMVALGSAMGGHRGGGRAGRGGISSGSGSGSTTSADIRRLIIDPNARGNGVGSLATMRTAPAAGPGQVINVIGVHTAEGQRLIGTSAANFKRRGG